MIKTPRIPMNRLAVALGLALAAVGAQAADLATASASVSNLRYRLIDLDPNDGIAASLTVTGNLTGTASTSIKITPDVLVDPYGYTTTPYIATQNPSDVDKSITSTVFGQTGTLELFSTVPGARAALGSTMSTSTSLSGAAIADSVLTSSYNRTYNGTAVDYSRGDNLLRNYTQTYSSSSRTTDAQQTAAINTVLDITPEVVDPDTGWPTSFPTAIPNITLSAHTLLVIEGTAQLALYQDQIGIDSAARAAWGPMTSIGSGYYNSSTNANLIVALGGDGQFGNLTTSLPSGAMIGQQHLDSFSLSNGFSQSGINAYAADGLIKQDVVDIQDFGVSYANLSGSSVQTVFNISLSAATNVSGYYNESSYTNTWGEPVSNVPVVTTPGIPEPSTYALMGLGLVGIALASRRQRPTKQA